MALEYMILSQILSVSSRNLENTLKFIQFIIEKVLKFDQF